MRKGASDQIVEYNRRFESIKDLYDSFLGDLFVSDFSYEKAYKTARRFFGSSKVEFAAIDGTEYTHPLFDMVIFFLEAFLVEGCGGYGGLGWSWIFVKKSSDEPKGERK